MYLVFDARPSTRDVDAIFQPSGEIRALVARVGQEMGLGDAWLTRKVQLGPRLRLGLRAQLNFPV